MILCGARTKRFYRSQEAFTMVEMLFVIVLMALLLAIGTVVFYGSVRNTDLTATAEMIKQDIRKVYAAADSGYAPAAGTDGIIHKDRYQIEFHLSGDSPANCYRVYQYSWSVVGSVGGYNTKTLVKPDKLSSNLTIGNQWIQPSASSDIQITGVTGAGVNQITFVPSGSIIQTDSTTGDATVTIRSQSQKKNIVITVSMFGSVE